MKAVIGCSYWACGATIGVVYHPCDCAVRAVTLSLRCYVWWWVSSSFCGVCVCAGVCVCCVRNEYSDTAREFERGGEAVRGEGGRREKKAREGR